MTKAMLLGIPIVVNSYVPTDEVWLVTQGDKVELHAHEGPKVGQKAVVWLSQHKLVRTIDLPKFGEIKLKEFFEVTK